MKEIMKPILLDADAALHVICHTCPKLLYEPESDDPITRGVAQSTADGHSRAFSKPHDVSILNGACTLEIYHTESQKSCIQEQLPA